jgi:hypothetical protein
MSQCSSAICDSAPASTGACLTECMSSYTIATLAVCTLQTVPLAWPWMPTRTASPAPWASSA